MLINCTPHEIVLRLADGSNVAIPPSGIVARIEETPGSVCDTSEMVEIYSPPCRKGVYDLPVSCKGTHIIVSSLVAQACPREDLVFPGTGPKDMAIRENGKIIAVTRLIAALDVPKQVRHIRW